MIHVIEAIERRVKHRYPRKFRKLLNRVQNLTDRKDEAFLWKAYTYARRAHKGQLRISGEPYFEHCYHTAWTLARMNMDIVTIAAGFLHDVLEDTDITLDDIHDEFGEEVCRLVDGVTKISDLDYKSLEEMQAGNFRKMLLSVIEDLRVIIIKFADRLHNMRTLSHLPESKVRRIAIETREVYAPLAHRLGMGKIKWELEDLALRALEPDAYAEIEKKVSVRRGERERYIHKVARPIRIKLRDNDIEANILGRPKHFSSIFGKMERRNKPFEEIYDLFAIRIIVESEADCYATLGVVHSIYNPVADRFKDFIATPKSNGYQSIHTTLVGPDGRMVEIQIRTHEMDRTAEDGIAAHWRYKEGKGTDEDLDLYMHWLRDLIESLQSDEADPNEFLQTLKIDLFKDEIFVFTPAGELKQLPIGSTPVDFAYAVHSEIGDHCIGAKVNGKIVPLNTQLASGESVEIIASDSQTPNHAWVKFVKTAKARSRIQKWQRLERRDQAIKLGKEIVEKEFKRRKIRGRSKKIAEVFSRTKFTDEKSLYGAIGAGNYSLQSLMKLISPPDESGKKEPDKGKKFLAKARRRVKGIRVQGMDSIMINFGNCCHPIPGDDIVGYITRGKGVTIHRVNCKDASHLLGANSRTVDVEWDTGRKEEFLVRLKVNAKERKHFLRDLTEVISDTNTNILNLDLGVGDEIVTTSISLQVRDVKHLNKLMNRIGGINGLISVERA